MILARACRLQWLKAWVVPGAVFQSVIVGGGYGTGREVVEFISSNGPQGGLVETVLIGGLFAIVLAVAFDYARQFEVRDYRRFIKSLLGPAWVAFEFFIILGLILVLAVAGSAAGSVLEDSFGWPTTLGAGLMLLIVVVFNYYGRQWVERTLTAWGMLMSVLLVTYAIIVFVQKGDLIGNAFESYSIVPGWWRSGTRFFLYTAAIIPTLLYATDHIETRRQAWGAGVIGGFLGALPGVKGRSLSPRAHATIAGGAVLASVALSKFGIVALVAKGYGSLAWVGLFLFVLPIMTVGVWKLWKAARDERPYA